MARKRPASPLEADANSSNGQRGLDAHPGRPAFTLRRSSRRATMKQQDGDDNLKKMKIHGKGIVAEKTAKPAKVVDSLGLDNDMPELVGNTIIPGGTVGGGVAHDVEVAIKDVARMERHLRKATRRQEKQQEKSNDNDRQKVSHRIQAKKESTNPADLNDKLSIPKTACKSWSAIGKHSSTPDLDTLLSDDHENVHDPEPDVLNEAGEETQMVPERGATRAPAINSPHLPLPWTGRLGYACLNTYLRSAKPPVFSSRTCRIASILEHRHPLRDPSQPEHATKNRPDKDLEADEELGMRFVETLGLANARDIIKMILWNDKYGIKFMRLSSEMFPFASHAEYGYRLAPFASEILAEAGQVAGKLGHRLTTHPGQFTQLASPRKDVIVASFRDLDYHDEMLSLLRLPEQQDRDAIMVLHMGGAYGDKAATLDRFRENYTKLPESVKKRLVLENDDVVWNVHELLPVCEELNIPLVLDYHHHNIVFDADKVREGTMDISTPEMTERIAATWRRKGITQKMHYSEPVPGAVTARDRRKHRARVMTLPPCPPDVDLMIEAKDKEQAVFELMRTLKLPGFERINDMVPHDREDESKPAPAVPKKKRKAKQSLRASQRNGIRDGMVHEDVLEAVAEGEDLPKGRIVSAEDFGMGGPLNRVYWPIGMEEWLKPRKREVKGKG